MNAVTTITLTTMLLLIGCDGDSAGPVAGDMSSVDAGAASPDDDTPADEDEDEEECSQLVEMASCQQVSACAGGCGTDTGCMEDCEAEGCSAAGAAFEVVKQCVIDNCLQLCATGENADCLACTESSCVDETAACNQQSCGSECELDPDNGDPDSPPEATGTSCLEILTCESSCDLIDFGCSESCGADACTGATDAASAVRTCSLFNCIFDCFNPDAPECTQCVTESCGTQLSECSAATCQ